MSKMSVDSFNVLSKIQWHIIPRFPFCGGGEDGSSVHTLLSGVVQVCHELLVGEEEEKEEEQGRQEEREVKGEGQSEENTRSRG